jgi:hypothetical protein
MSIAELVKKVTDVELVQMTFDPELSVDVCNLIYVMYGDRMPKLTDEQWQETRERCADVMEQFLTLRHEAADLERNLKFYVRKHNDLEAHFMQTHGRQAYREFMDEMDEHHARYAREIKLSSKLSYKTHMWVKGEK